MVPERLARVDVRQMHLDRGDVHRRERVAERIACMGEGARVQNDSGMGAACLVDRVDQGALVVRLAEVYLDNRWRIVDPQNELNREDEHHFVAMRVLGKAGADLSSTHQLVGGDEGLEVTMR